MVEEIKYQTTILALIVRHTYSNDGITFFTSKDFSQQLAYMNHHKGHVIQPHVHNIVRREVLYTNEVLVIKKGTVKIDFYTDKQEYVSSRMLEKGDIILLVSGGHGFEMLEDTEMYEIKQGPYAGETDKTRFIPKNDENN